MVYGFNYRRFEYLAFKQSTHLKMIEPYCELFNFLHGIHILKKFLKATIKQDSNSKPIIHSCRTIALLQARRFLYKYKRIFTILVAQKLMLKKVSWKESCYNIIFGNYIIFFPSLLGNVQENLLITHAESQTVQAHN